MAPILSSKDEVRNDIPKKLCQMDNHLACINCVRWSNHGKYLASAGDDKNLMVWTLAGRINHHPSNHNKSQNNVFESANIEQWRCIATLNGHNGDILDLGWSPGDQYLASCSVDNMIIVWDAKNFPQVITKITGHTGLVKGVSWDPTGKYLASQSDDKTLRVWKTTDWREEAVVKEPFKECGGTTHVLRLNWSPDGQTLVSAHAMNNSGSVAQLIERDGWRTQRDLVGHRKAVTCVRFNPNILHQNKTKRQNQQSERITNSGNNNSNSNGTTSKAGANKSNSNINPPINKTIKYCCIAIGSRDRSISVWLTSQPRPLIVAHDLFESSVLDISWSKDGYRLLACSQDGTVAVMIFSPAELGQKLTSDEKQAHLQKLYGKSITAAPTRNKTLIVEDPELIKAQAEQNQKNREISDQHSSHSNSISQNGYNGCESNTSMSGMSKGPTDRQIETLLPGGKRRITPLYIQPPVPFNSTSSITFSSSKESKTKIMIETTTSTPVPTPTPSFAPTTPVKTTTTIPTTITLAPKVKSRTLPQAKIDKATAFKIKDADGRELILEVDNANAEKLHELRLMNESNKTIWDSLLSSRINSVIATQTMAVSSCDDNSLHLFELSSGRRLVPPILLDSPVAHIAGESDYLLVVTSSASMWLWDMSQNKVLIKAESLSPILTDSEIQITSCSLTQHYQPLFLLSTGRAFLYDYNLHCWLLIADSNDPITRWSSCKPSLPTIKRFLDHKPELSIKKNLPLTILSSQLSFNIKPFASVNKSESLQVKATKAYLDHQLASALAIRSSDEYHYWLIQSVHHFVDTGAEDRLKELCSRLTSAFGGDEDDTILGLSKRTILREVLTILSKDLRYQRIYSEYKQLLDYESTI